MIRVGNRRGMTLVELVVVLAIIGVISGVAGLSLHGYIARWQVRNAANQVFDDLQKAQQAARQIGNYVLTSGGLLAEKRVFWVFDLSGSRYEVFRWQDEDGDGNPESGESAALFSADLTDGIVFGTVPGVDRTACSDTAGAPSASVTFSAANDPPCSSSRCIRINKFGFSETGPGGIYLTRGDVSYAITMTRPGNIAMCRWDGGHWQTM